MFLRLHDYAKKNKQRVWGKKHSQSHSIPAPVLWFLFHWQLNTRNEINANKFDGGKMPELSVECLWTSKISGILWHDREHSFNKSHGIWYSDYVCSVLYAKRGKLKEWSGIWDCRSHMAINNEKNTNTHWRTTCLPDSVAFHTFHKQNLFFFSPSKRTHKHRMYTHKMEMRKKS